MDELLQEFIAETRETLEALAGEIIAWEAAPDDRARLDAIFRFVHTVKGSCGFLDLPRLSRLSHAAEDVLAAARDGHRTPDRALVDAVLAIVDRIGHLVEAIAADVALDDSDEDALVAALAEGAAIAVAAPIASTAGPRVAARSVRLSVDLLDQMMSGMSDMVLARNELARRLRDEGHDPATEAALERLSASVADMRDTVTRTRMQKIEALFSALPRLVRDTAASVGKSVTLVIEGSEVELDREMIEVMRDPIIHIIRNAIDHGIEAPAARRAAGKRENGRLTVSARQAGNQIVIEIADDGAGVDVERLVAKQAAGGRDARQLRGLSDKAKLDLVFEAGLSSRDAVTEISGRGVGMDVVRTAIEGFGGRIELENLPGRGLTIAIHVPLTLSIIPTIVVGVGAERFAISRQAIEEIVKEGAEGVRIDWLGNAAVVTVRDRRMPLLDLGEQLELERPARGAMLAIVSVGSGSYALAVEEVLDTEELVIKPAAPGIMATGIYAGQTLPDTGRPMLMLDCAGLAADAGLSFGRAADVIDEVYDEVVREDALMFRDLDGAYRAIPLGLVDRVEKAAPDAVVRAGGTLRLTAGGQILPLAALAPVPAGETVGILRLHDGDAELAYAMAEPVDIVPLPPELAPAPGAEGVAGVMLVDDTAVEVIDAYWLFATHGGAIDRRRPVCRLDGEAAWMTRFLRPMLEKAGYAIGESGAADVVLSLDGAGDGGAVKLRSARVGADDTIYRYDRSAILAAVEARVAGGAR